MLTGHQHLMSEEGSAPPAQVLPCQNHRIVILSGDPCRTLIDLTLPFSPMTPVGGICVPMGRPHMGTRKSVVPCCQGPWPGSGLDTVRRPQSHTHLLDHPRKRLCDSSSFPGGGFSTSKHCSVHLSLVPVEKGAFGCWESPGPCSLQGSIEMC